jgi:hypothetical protein
MFRIASAFVVVRIALTLVSAAEAVGSGDDTVLGRRR